MIVGMFAKQWVTWGSTRSRAGPTFESAFDPITLKPGSVAPRSGGQRVIRPACPENRRTVFGQAMGNCAANAGRGSGDDGGWSVTENSLRSLPHDVPDPRDSYI